jgi:RHS repeat-associated protein
MISEITDGVILDYVPDALGSIHSVIDQDANVVKTMRYKPYGEVLSRSGTVADRHYQWVGSYGYRSTFAPSSSHYVRARHYSATAGSWSTVDPLWPRESAYGYVGGRVSAAIDPRGTAPITGPGGPGNNFGACAIFICTEHTMGTGIWGIIPTHQFVCVRGPHGGCSGGNYPPGIGNANENCSSSSSLKRGDTCTKVSTDCNLANLMCACMRTAVKSGYPYLYINNCMTFASEMFQCACNALKAAGKVSPGCNIFNATMSPPEADPPETLIGPPYTGE